MQQVRPGAVLGRGVPTPPAQQNKYSHRKGGGLMMEKLSPAQWFLWFEVAGLELFVAIHMVSCGAWRRWASLFFFLAVLTLKDSIRLANALTAHNSFVDFYVYWSASLVAELLEVWIIVQIAQQMLGISPAVRRAIARTVVGMAAICCVLSIWRTVMLHRPSWETICDTTEQLSNAVALAWVIVLVIVALFANHVAEWSAGVRGIALGITLELTADSYIGWLRITTNTDRDLLDLVKGSIFMVSLILWGASIERRDSGQQSPLTLTELFKQIENLLNSSRRLRSVSQDDIR
jgi:hypothetical protein